jgi:hypothetical protein
MIVFGHPGMSLQEYVDNFTAFLTSKCSTGLQLECHFAAKYYTPALLAFNLGTIVSLGPPIPLPRLSPDIPTPRT